MDIKRNLISRYRFLSKSLLLTVAISGLSACGESEFSVGGIIQNGQNKSVVLERGENGHWISLDSATIEDDGTFDINFMSPKYADIYRLRMNDKFVYLPIDSTENLTLETTADNFGTDYVLSGSEQARKMTKFENEVNKLDFSDEIEVERFKRDVYESIIKDSKASVLSYYVLTKVVDDKFLFDSENLSDAKFYTAVATSYREFKPNDPRTKLLENIALEMQRKRQLNSGKVKEVETVAFLEIELKDSEGKNKKLSEVVGNGKPTVVVFSLLTHAESPAFNKQLSDLKVAKNDKFNIYQVCMDDDQLAWQSAAKNLPWTVVYDPDGLYSIISRTYNVEVLPVFYIYDDKGELAASAISFEKLAKHLNRYL